jgi:antitoxin PrlF
MQSALAAKCQATIPKPIRDHLGLKPGDKVTFSIQPDGSVVILPMVPITALRGFLKSRVGPVSIEDMDTAIAEGAARQSLLRKRKWRPHKRLHIFGRVRQEGGAVAGFRLGDATEQVSESPIRH